MTIHLGEQSHKEKLVSGDNVFRIEIPEVSTTRQLPLTLTSGKEKEETTVTVKPVRHWQMNMVQHTHTDIGYTPFPKWKSWQNSFDTIDYALDYCDATDNYPDFAKFRWTCEIAWAVSEYLKLSSCGTDRSPEATGKRGPY